MPTKPSNDADHATPLGFQMDAPSAQLHLELREAIQEALSTRRPLVHRLNECGSWVLQIPRPESAVRHGSRVYWNVVVDPSFDSGGEEAGWKGYLLGSKRRKKQAWQAVGSVAEVEELLRSNEILASGLRLGNGRKSNAADELETGRVETFIDAVLLTAQDTIHVPTLRAIHADVPLFCPPPLVPTITSLAHFRTTVPIADFGADGDRDWRSTSLPPLPDWLGIGALPPSTPSATDESSAVLAIAFNNQYHSHSSKLASISTSGAAGGERKRHATIVPDEDEEAAEVVIFAPSGLSRHEISQVVYGDPPTRVVACVGGRRQAGRTKATAREDAGVEKVLRARYWLSAHEEAREENWVASWFRKPKTFAFGDMAADERAAKRARGKREDSPRDGEVEMETEYGELIAGESSMLR